MATDLYATLGVGRNASAEEIKKAYRKLARRYHPDRNPGDKQAEERFKEVQNAYDVLSNPDKRKQYDTFGTFDGRAGVGQAPGGFTFQGGAFDLGDLGSLFGDLLGGAPGRGRGRRAERGVRGGDLEVELNLSFEDSLRGMETRIPVEAVYACSTCNGTGAAPGTAPTLCPQCGGRGLIAESQGLFAISQPCPRCGGTGRVIETPCPTCRGSGRERRTKRYTVKIPAGVRDGTRIRLRGKGEPGFAGGPPGDLYVVTRVEPSRRYERRGSDLIVDVPISYPEAVLGTTVQVQTPDGSISLKVPAGTEPGKLLRVRGRGAPRLNGSGRGDLLARIRLTVPKKLTKAEREALEQFQKVSRENPREAVT
jgi:molecular chaperone DnaJ